MHYVSRLYCMRDKEGTFVSNLHQERGLHHISEEHNEYFLKKGGYRKMKSQICRTFEVLSLLLLFKVYV